jgi:hypothetical protein
MLDAFRNENPEDYIGGFRITHRGLKRSPTDRGAAPPTAQATKARQPGGAQDDRRQRADSLGPERKSYGGFQLWVSFR